MLEGDLAGFPNGRRLEDDVIDIELRALADGYGAILNGALGLPQPSPNNLIGDGVDQNDVPFLTRVPVRRDAAPGVREPRRVGRGRDVPRRRQSSARSR